MHHCLLSPSIRYKQTLSMHHSISHTLPPLLLINFKHPTMEKPEKIIRRSVHMFLKKYNHFTWIAVFLLSPFSASVLLSQALPYSLPLLQVIHSRLLLLFDAAGFPSSSQLFSILKLKLSQTITSSVLILPFTFFFLLSAKASIIQALQSTPLLHGRVFISSVLQLYHSLLLTYVCNCIVIIAANASAFALSFLIFNCLDAFGFSSPYILLLISATSGVLYSIILANAIVICNMAIVVSGMENCSGYTAILRACALIQGKAATAVALALPSNLGFAAIEALFMVRVVKAYQQFNQFSLSLASEAVLIAYLYSIFVVLDTVMGCMFYKSCKSGSQSSKFKYKIDSIEEKYDCADSKIIQEFP
ncbi:hypothetical protein ACLOJK_004167 [Asimina triloba]